MDKFTINKSTKSSLLLLLFITQLTLILGSHADEFTPAEGEFLPVGPTEYRVMDLGAGEGRRKLAEPYEICKQCKCCAKGIYCASMPCCFHIDCQLPNKPFGTCAFRPKVCKCNSCAKAN